MMPESPTISVVVPVFNEEGSIATLCQRVRDVMDTQDLTFELLVVDDGSTDETCLRVSDLFAEIPSLRLIESRRNFGKATALNIGFRHCQGAVVITMDGDLQDDPKEIPRFLKKLDEGFDLVSGWKEKRHDPWHKTFPSKLFNAVTVKMCGLQLHDYNCGFKAYRREVVESLNLYGEMHRYIPALAHWMGFRVGEIPVEHHARTTGHSKYGVERFTRGLFDFLTIGFLTRFNGRPMHFFGKWGLSFLALGSLGCGYLAWLWFYQRWCGAELVGIGNRPLLQVSILGLVTGLLSLATGLLAELMFFLNKSRELPKHLVRRDSLDDPS